MLIGGYKIRHQSAPHFLTFSVVDWVDIFTRQLYRDLIVDSLKFCQENKGLLLHAWCIMTNHLHLIMSAREKGLSDLLRGFKKYTSAQLVKAVSENKYESRREWMLRHFAKAGQENSRNPGNQFWQQDNHPVELYSAAFIAQKLNYIHENPVRAGWVEKPEHYLYSSSRNYVSGWAAGLLDVVFL